jgi:predicted O-methyltransferase YrrM
MRFQFKLSSTIEDLFSKRKIRTLIKHPRRVLSKYILALEDAIDQEVPWVDSLAFSMSKQRLHKLMDKEDSLDDVLYTAFNYTGYWVYRSIRPQQIRTEIEQLVGEIEGVSPSTILEIGTSNGGTLYIWARSIKSCRRIISIDLPEGYPYTSIKFFKSFDQTKAIDFLRGNSHSEKTLDAFTQVLGHEKIDFLYIDGDHSYEGVKQDFMIYRQFMARGGIVAFHDIMHHENYGVDRFWKEVRRKYASKEIIASQNQQGYGIGVLYF